MFGRIKASIRANVEHPFRVIKRQFGFTQVRYRGLVENTGQILTLFASGKLWMARSPLMGVHRDQCVREGRETQFLGAVRAESVSSRRDSRRPMS